MSETLIIRPHNSPRNVYSPRTVLVVASEGSLNIPDDLKAFTEGSNGLNVHFAKRLPLPCGTEHPPIDLVVFVYKVFNNASFEVIRESLPYLDIRYLVGRCFVLIYSDCKYSQPDIREVEEFAKSMNIPSHPASKQKVPDSSSEKCRPRLQFPSELLSVYCPPAESDVDSLLVDAAMSHCPDI